jgi:hypothetical protein
MVDTKPAANLEKDNRNFESQYNANDSCLVSIPLRA